MKKCEVCGTEIPADFQNLLCLNCYQLQIEEQKIKDAQIAEELEKSKQNPDSPLNPANVAETTPVYEAPGAQIAPPQHVSGFGITDPDYTENPEMDDKNQVLANMAQFIYTHDPTKGKKGKLLWYPQRNMYNFVRNYCLRKVLDHPQYPKYIWKPKIVDVGCGSGVGSNIISQEADFVWGIDKNQLSIEFAREAFTREKNGLYYSTQLSFDHIDILNDTRLFMMFDVVVAIEVIEHIYDTWKFLQALTRFTKRDKRGNVRLDDPTEFFISTPNRNFPKIRKDKPENVFHVREWRAQEFHQVLKKVFQNVEFMNQKGEMIAMDDEANEVIFAKCSVPTL